MRGWDLLNNVFHRTCLYRHVLVVRMYGAVRPDRVQHMNQHHVVGKKLAAGSSHRMDLPNSVTPRSIQGSPPPLRTKDEIWNVHSYVHLYVHDSFPCDSLIASYRCILTGRPHASYCSVEEREREKEGGHGSPFFGIENLQLRAPGQRQSRYKNIGRGLFSTGVVYL